MEPIYKNSHKIRTIPWILYATFYTNPVHIIIEPNKPKDIAIYIQNKILILERSAQNITDTNSPNKIITPPIVGVPIFFTIWSSGPSSRIGFKIFCLEKNLINGPPIISTITNEVKKDKPVLKVKYLNTFKKLKVSTKFNKNWWKNLWENQ